MERKTVTVKDFKEIGKNNEYFLWHFLQKDQEDTNLAFYSIFKDRGYPKNSLDEILPSLKIPYYESLTEESVDFLINSGVNRKVWAPPAEGTNPKPKELFTPVILLFKGYNLRSTTFETCYCVEGLLDMIGKENPELLRDFI